MTDDSLDWLAMQYVLDELPAAERTAFELQLENDLAACEAVARASRLQIGLEQAFATNDIRMSTVQMSTVGMSPGPQGSSRPRQSASAIMAVSTMLACLLLIALFVPRRGGQRDFDIAQLQTSERVLPKDHENIELVSLWRSGMNRPEMETDESEEEFQDPPAPDGLPSWLLAGVSLEMNEAPRSGKDN